MKIVILLVFLLISSVSCTDPDVYVCDSRNAIRYHYRQNCRGLSNCTYHIIQVKESEAKKSSKTLCHWENE